MEVCTDCRKWAPGTKHEYFINVLLGDFSQQLWIPPRFYYHIEDKVNSAFLLTGPNRKPYTVQLAKINNRLCFKGGWRTFAEENSFKEEELLLIGYDGEVSFTVEVFSNTACQRGGLQDKVNVGASCSNPIIIGTKEEKEDSTDTSGESNEDSSSRDMSRGETKGEEKDDEDEEVEEESTDTSRESNEDSSSTEMSGGESNEDSSSTEMSGGETKDKKPAARKQKYAKCFISRRRPVIREEKKKALSAAAAMESPFPSFIVTMKPTCVYRGFYVNIPVDFLRDYDILGETRTIKVQNVEGREWPVRLLRRGDRCGVGGSGWSVFVYDNNLEEGDVCVFELVDKKKKKKMLVLKVNIFRVVEETTPLRVGKTGRR